MVYSYLKESNQESIFKSGKPTDKWYYSFLNRHPDLRVRLAQNIASDRARSVSNEILKDFYDKLLKIIEENNITQEDIYNTDETGFQCDQGYLLQL